ncbi:uncharacterized protein At2g39920 [Euphorbia lathyris]|uniref:uncharacterized protein At2g39920 n=1 Tax=Euphorbia lathyris TaxID=212925 RepID=UPI003313C187
MSAYAHQMERAFSARSLSSRGGSEMESHYMVESGFYMTSFAATIFIGSLITVAILFVTLLIALTVMLQSCENRSKGVIEIQNLYDNYSYCKTFGLHAELNKIGPNYFPSFCKNLAIQHIREGHFEIDLNSATRLVEEHYGSSVPSNDGLDIVLMDIDDVLPSDPHYTYPIMNSLYQYGYSGCFAEAKHLSQKRHLKLYMELQARGWLMILLSRKPEILRNVTEEYLISTGYRSWSSVIMRMDEEMEMESHVHFLKQRMMIQKEGFRIAGVISSQMDVLTGTFSGHHNFKLPNPIYYYFDHPKEINEQK